MTAPCFVDANVLVYARDPSDLRKFETARNVLNGLWRDLSGRTSIQVLSEFYTVCARKLSAHVSAEEAWADVEELFRWNPQPIDLNVLQRARKVEERYKLNWWDCLVVAAAQVQGCAVLYSEDMQHGAVVDGVRICNPFAHQVQEQAAPYRVTVDSPHRPRGRPRKVA